MAKGSRKVSKVTGRPLTGEWREMSTPESREIEKARQKQASENHKSYNRARRQAEKLPVNEWFVQTWYQGPSGRHYFIGEQRVLTHQAAREFARHILEVNTRRGIYVIVKQGLVERLRQDITITMRNTSWYVQTEEGERFNHPLPRKERDSDND